jgi:hypothetical protein
MKKTGRLRDLGSRVLEQSLQTVLGFMDGADAEQGQPFLTPEMMVPHTDSRFYGWTHYGVMIPDLPAPHRFFSIMSIIGMPGALAFDTDHALVDTPRRNATVVSGTAATYPQHFGGYSTARDCEMAADGSIVRFGKAVCISGRWPDFRVQASYGDFVLDMSLRASDKVSWFMRSAIYDHLSLLSEYRGVIEQNHVRTEIAGLCTFEYAACVSPYVLRDRRLPDRLKLPLDFFTYQIINLDEGTQLLMTQAMVLGRPLLTALYVRSLDTYSRTCRQARFEVLEAQAELATAPDGKRMRLPQRMRWRVEDEGRAVLDIVATVDTPFTYGLGSGYVGAYHYAGQYEGLAVSGRGYVEYIDRRTA